MVIDGKEVLRARSKICLADAAIAPAVMLKSLRGGCGACVAIWGAGPRVLGYDRALSTLPAMHLIDTTVLVQVGLY